MKQPFIGSSPRGHNVSLPDSYLSDLRHEARAWLSANVPRQARPTAGIEMRDFDVAWQRAQFEGGWAGISWPTEYGGRGLGLREQMVWTQEYARAGGPYAGCCYVGINHGGPTLMARGTREQQLAHVKQILAGEQVWCQGFSEPDAGSDLLSLRTRAIRDGDEFVVNGEKIWTSYGQFADFQELLVRSDPSSRRGLTWLICDMDSPGIEIRPIKNMARSEHFCHIYYRDVRIPTANVVGEVDAGWDVALTTLSFERGTGFMAEQMELARMLDELAQVVRAQLRDPRGMERLGTVETLSRARADVMALGAMAEALIELAVRGEDIGAGGSLLRIFHSDLIQRIAQLGVELHLPDAVEFRRAGLPGGWSGDYLRSFSAPIAGGTADIHRNIVGERLLQLPRSR